MTLQQGANGYTGGQAATVLSASPNEEFTSLLYIRNGYAAILFFDVSQIPVGAQIISAFLTLTFYETNNAGGQMLVGRLLNPDNSPAWQDIGSDNDLFNQKATYRFKDEATALKWSTVGAGGNISDVIGTADDSYTPPIFFTGTHDFDVKSMVSAWVSGTLLNSGLYVIPGSADPNSRLRGNYFATVTARPKLTIIYNPNQSSSSCSSSSSSRSSSSSCRSSSSSCSSSSSRSSSSSSSSKGSSSSCSSSCRSSSSSSSCRSSSSSSSSIQSQFQTQTFTSGGVADLPADDVVLPYAFSSTDYAGVAVADGTYYGSTDESEFTVHMFTKIVQPGLPFTVSWTGKTDLAPATSNVFMQLLNRTTQSWETVAQNNSAAVGVNFTLTATKSTGMSDYLDELNKVSCRVYQELIYD